jgi:hypothetical protein
MSDTTITRRTRVAALAAAGALAGSLALAPAATAAPPPGGQVHSTSPTRLLDTRTGIGTAAGAVSPGGVIAVAVLGQGGVPSSGVSAVVLHVTVTQAAHSGYITVWPNGVAKPTASTLNFAAGETISNSTFVSVGTGGVVDLYNGSPGTVQLIADVTGYVDTFGGDGRGAFGTLTPARLLDTRTGNGAPAAPIPPGGTVHVTVVGRGGVPPVNNGFGYSAAVLNIAAVQPAGSGYLTAYADDASRPGTSNLNLTSGRTHANLAVVPIGSGGGVDLYNGSSQSVELIADVSGYFSGGAPNSGNQFARSGPTRVLDTRYGIGVPQAAVGPGHTITVTLNPGLPVSAVFLNLTVTSPTGAGYLTAWAHGTARPTTSDLNFTAGETIASLNMVPTAGTVDIYNGSSGTVQIVGDEFGYITGN